MFDPRCGDKPELEDIIEICTGIMHDQKGREWPVPVDKGPDTLRFTFYKRTKDRKKLACHYIVTTQIIKENDFSFLHGIREEVLIFSARVAASIANAKAVDANGVTESCVCLSQPPKPIFGGMK